MLLLKPKKSKTNVLINIYFLIFIVGILFIFIQQFRYGDHQVVWNLSEWLINYQGGFVRRGLRGEIIYQLYTHFNFAPYTTIRVITASAYIILASFFFINFIKKGYSLFILPCVFLIGNPVLNGFWIRLDCILCLLMVGIIYFLARQNRFYIIWVNLLLILGILLHEIFIFITIPILVFLLINNLRNCSKRDRSFAYYFFLSIFLLLPSFFAFILVYIHNGSEDIVVKIWQSWGSEPFSFDFSSELYGSPYPGALQAIGFNIQEGLLLSQRGMLFFSNGVYNPFMVLLSILTTFYILSNINVFNFKILRFQPNVNHNKPLISTVLFFQFCTTVPLYLLGYDYGRWIFFWVVSSFIILMLVPEEKLSKVIPQIFYTISDKINMLFTRLLGNTKSTIIILSSIIGFTTTLWFFDMSIKTSSFYVVISTLSLFVKKIFIFLNIHFLWT